jgi:hypothetical protein
MSCTNGITAAITNDCSAAPTGGMNPKAWAINRTDIASITYDGTKPLMVTGITLAATKKAFPITGFKKTSNVGFDLVVSDTLPDMFTNYFSFQPWAKDAASLANYAAMNDIVIIAEAKGQKTEGCFQIYGLTTGLYKTSGSKRINDNAGVPTFEFASQAGEEETAPNYSYWDTSYATSLADLVALEA